MSGRRLLVGILVALLFTSCQKNVGEISLDFSFSVDDKAVVLDTMDYVNEAGNLYEISDIQFFISNVLLTKADGSKVSVKSDGGIHYVDIALPHTLHWQPSDDIPEGIYSSISFVFGIVSNLNTTGLFPNAPENNMSWPGFLGGGYHYMKINGKWKDPDGKEVPFNLHMGPGQERDHSGTVTGFIDNSFTVELPLANFTVQANALNTVGLSMNVNNWFKEPFVFDFNVVGGSIMQNQQAQELLKENGANVFSIVR